MTTLPFDWIREDARSTVLFWLTVLVVAASAWIFSMDRSLVTEAAPNGIVSFELAQSVERSEAILASWPDAARSVAMLIQGVDYLYLFLYPAWFALAAQLLGSVHSGILQQASAATAWLILLAVPLDAVENYALIQQLLHGASASMAGLAFWCAVPKFVLVVGAAMQVLLATGFWLAKRNSAS